MTIMTDGNYPIGKFHKPEKASTEELKQWIHQMRDLPADLRSAVQGLTEEQLDHPCREGGWTVRQVAHHIPDSHVNGYIRFKMGLTEEEPVIKPYDQEKWSELYDVRSTPVEVSLTLLEAVHARWVVLLESLQEEVFSRTFRHPESGVMNLTQVLALYAWHGRHHTAAILTLRKEMGW